MKTKQFVCEDQSTWQSYDEGKITQPQLVLFFGAFESLTRTSAYNELRNMFPQAHLLGCSTAGEIIGDEVMDDSVVATAIEFAQTELKTATLCIDEMTNSYAAGLKLGTELKAPDLKAVFVLSDGQQVNGSDLVEGLSEALGKDIIITGGLAGDGGRFEQTLVSCDTPPESKRIAALGFYGEAIQIGHGSVGGWDTFGPERIVTRSDANVLLELDGKPALELYKKYLGEQADELPGSALLFPLMIRPAGNQGIGTVRTVLSVDEETQSMTFAGNLPEGYSAQLMMANFDQLVGGASEAAEIAQLKEASDQSDTLAVLISCVGRKMVLGQRIGDEVESVFDIMGCKTKQVGFYSYGEISPHVEIGNCQLHNQTMTITTISEHV